MYIHTKYSTSHHNHITITFSSNPEIQLCRSVISRNEELGIYVYIFKRSDQTSPPLFFFVRRIHSLGVLFESQSPPSQLSMSTLYKTDRQASPIEVKGSAINIFIFYQVNSSIHSLTHLSHPEILSVSGGETSLSQRASMAR